MECFPCFRGLGHPRDTVKGRLPPTGCSPVFWQTFHCAAEKQELKTLYAKSKGSFILFMKRLRFLMSKSLGDFFFFTLMVYLWSCYLHLWLYFLENRLFFNIFMSTWCLCGHLHIKPNKAVGQCSFSHVLYKLPIHIKGFLCICFNWNDLSVTLPLLEVCCLKWLL